MGIKRLAHSFYHAVDRHDNKRHNPADALNIDCRSTPSQPAMKLNSLRIFISYPRGGASHTWAEAVEAHLLREGARAWRDETGVLEGDPNWYARIESELQAADLLVAIIGMDSRACDWQMRELLAAVGQGKPIVALRVDDRAQMPLVLCEKQPVEARPDRAATLTVLVEALQRTASTPPAAPGSNGSASAGIPPDQRAAEIVWLESLLYGNLSARPDLYVPLEGIERSSPHAERSLKKVCIATDSLFKAFGVADAAAKIIEARPYSDVLDAYRELGGRKVRRLAVLGEPGAGKSFSLERIALAYADRAMHDALAPIPLLVQLGLWTRPDETLKDFIASQLEGLGCYLLQLIAKRRAVLLLDAINEIPPGQRRHKTTQILTLAQDERLASVVISCREKDFAEFSLPFDTLTLQPLSPPRVRDFLHRYHEAQYGPGATEAAEVLFWQIAGGAEVRNAWEAWRRVGAEDLFWTADDIPTKQPDVCSQTNGLQHRAWRRSRFDPRSLLRLAANPYLLYIMAQLPDPPDNRAKLFQGFLDILYDRERKAREDRHDPHLPEREPWLLALTQLAEALQRLSPVDGDEGAAGARTTLTQAEWPAGIDKTLIDFSRDASVLELRGSDLRFTHQLLQEYLASRLLLDASQGRRPAADFWPAERWWERSGWEVVAEIAAESCAGDAAGQIRLIAWIAEANPEVAEQIWRHAGTPALPATLLAHLSARWMPLMTDPARMPQARARAAIGRAMGRLGLDRRPGVDLRADGLPDIDWVSIPGPQPFIYQGTQHLGLPTFEIARYPVTNAQFQAFIDAGGYQDERWWQGLEHALAAEPPKWDEPNSPRENVNWYEALAFCRWLSAATGVAVSLPTEVQWERAARGCEGREYPWGSFESAHMNCAVHSDDDGEADIGRTSAVGLFPQGATPPPEQVFDLSGNVWEWCRDAYRLPIDTAGTRKVSRVLRGGAWNLNPDFCRAAFRYFNSPDFRNYNFGFRVSRGYPIEPRGAAPLSAEAPSR